MTPVSVQNITKRFGAVEALHDVSIEIAGGELFFLLGPSGCGKTTLLRTIAGFYDPDGGRILFGDQDATHVPPQRRDTGMVFQNYALWPHMTVESNVAFGLRVRRVPRAEQRRRVAEALDLVKMGAYAKRKPNQLSGGQQQRVALARALVIRPRCLLLDEPLSNLDAKLRLDMRSEIRRLCKEFGLTAIYVTHDQKEALSIADRIAVMFDGQVGQVGAPREVYRQPSGARIADFLGETNFLSGTVTDVEGAERRVQTEAGELRAWAPDAPTAGACVLSIRPEAIAVTPTDAAATPVSAERCVQLDARVEGVVFLGDAAQLTVAVRGARLRALYGEPGGSPLSAGALVRCSIDPRDIVILKSETTGNGVGS